MLLFPLDPKEKDLIPPAMPVRENVKQEKEKREKNPGLDTFSIGIDRVT